MKVLQVYSGNLYGGVETIMLTFAKGQEMCPEMETHFALCFEGRLAEEIRAAGAPLYLLGEVRASRPHTVLRARRAFKKLLQSIKFDVVMFHYQWAHGILGSVARAMGLPVVNCMQNPTDAKHWTERWAKSVGADLLLCASENTAKSAHIQFPNTPYEVYRSPMPFISYGNQKFSRDEVRKELNTPAATVVITQASRTEAWKGHIMHVKALARLRDVPNWVCWQIGGPQRPFEVIYFDEVKALARELGIADRIMFLGQRSDVPRLLAASDIYCQPNKETEGFSLVFMEACYARLPLVTTDLGSAGEMVDENCGVLVPPEDDAALAETLKRLIADAPLRQQMGANANKKLLRMCDTGTQIRALHQIFAQQGWG